MTSILGSGSHVQLSWLACNRCCRVRGFVNMFTENYLEENERLRQQLAALAVATNQPARRSGETASQVDVVVTPNEMNDKHGTGALVRRIFEGCSHILSIRARNDYEGEHDFGDTAICLPQAGYSRWEAFQNVLAALRGKVVRRVICIPYVADDLVTSIAIKELFGVPLCTYIMDDQNICSQRIPDELMREFLAKCSLRLTTHAEMRNAYESKYGLKFWLLPQLIPGRLVQGTPKVPAGEEYASRTGALVGSIWSERWFNLLKDTIKGSGYQLHWFGNNNSPYLQTPRTELEEACINPFGIIPEDRLALLLRTYPYAVVPTGTPDDKGDALALGRLSLPGRIFFILATSNTPIIVLGHEESPAARFIKRFQIGVTSTYCAEGFRRAVEHVTDPRNQLVMRQKAAALAACLSADGIGEWFFRSMELGEPYDLRFEKLLPRAETDMVAYIEPPVPGDIYREYIPIYQVMRRLKNQGFRPDFVVDIGASMGIWSHAVSKVFPMARFVLVDPLFSRYDKWARERHIGAIPNAELVDAAISNQAGKSSFQVPPDLYGGSLLRLSDGHPYETVEVSVQTLDEVADVQFTEHLVLEGGRRFLEQVDAVVLELSLIRPHEQSKTFLEMMNVMHDLGYRYYDDVGSWRSPVDGTLVQKDVLFLRGNLLIKDWSN
jgi:FkbM family methyltransferase